MVKFTSARPSIGGMKSYYNHRTAFGGQWRNLRPQPRTSTTINFRSYNYNNCCSPMGCGGGFGFSWFPKAMGWMNMFSMGANLLGGILNMFMPQQPTYPVYPTEQKIDDKDNKKIDEPEKKVEPEKKKEPEKETPTKNTDKPNTNIFAYEVKHVPATEGKEEEVTETLTTEVDVPKGKKSAYCGWETLWKAYGIDVPIWSNEGKALRNWFRKEYLEGNDIWNSGTKQNFPTKISYNGKEYNFNKETFLNPIDRAEGSGSVNTDNMDKIEIKVKKTTNGTEEYWTLHNKATGERIDQTQYSSADAANKAGEAWKIKQK